MNTHLHGWRKFGCIATLCTQAIMLATCAGCERPREKQETEKILDVEAPGFDVEVQKSKETGTVNVKVKPDE